MYQGTIRCCIQLNTKWGSQKLVTAQETNDKLHESMKQWCHLQADGEPSGVPFNYHSVIETFDHDITLSNYEMIQQRATYIITDCSMIYNKKSGGLENKEMNYWLAIFTFHSYQRHLMVCKATCQHLHLPYRMQSPIQSSEIILPQPNYSLLKEWTGPMLANSLVHAFQTSHMDTHKKIVYSEPFDCFPFVLRHLRLLAKLNRLLFNNSWKS